MSATPQQMCIMVLDALFTLRPGPRVAQKMRSPYGQLRLLENCGGERHPPRSAGEGNIYVYDGPPHRPRPERARTIFRTTQCYGNFILNYFAMAQILF